MSILCTFPGRHGDLLWALPTMRALAEIYGPVDLLIAGEFDRIVPLVAQQPYLAKVHADPAWGMSHGYLPPGREDVISPYEKTLHLGYQRWPENPLPVETYLNAVAAVGHALPQLDLSTPWITRPYSLSKYLTGFGWTDCHFELKYGLTDLVWPDYENERHVEGIFPPGSRWITEGGFSACSWDQAATMLARMKVFLTDCSALHVLAVAMGTPVIIVEPMQERWNPIFYPCGMDGLQVQVVRGLDGNPTYDARHVKEILDGHA